MPKDATARAPIQDEHPASSLAESDHFPRGVADRMAAILLAVRAWWAGRHYHPERQYMRGGDLGVSRAKI